MRLIATVAVLTLSLAQPVLAQEPVPDTTSAWRYFLLGVGNVWEFDDYYEQCDPDGNCEGPDHVESVRWWVRATSEVDGLTYFDLRAEAFTPEGEPDPSGPREYRVRFDTTSARIVHNGPDIDVSLDCPFDAAFGESVSCSSGVYAVSGGYEESVTIGGETLSTTRKAYRRDGAEFVAFAFAPDVGLVYEEAGGYAPFFEWSRFLTYARVSGVEYGVPRFPVATEASPPSSAVALAVYPNPVRAAATVQFTLGAQQRVTLAVYDVLGRRVALLYEGLLPAGSSRLPFDAVALPAGVYFARATSTGATATASFTVVR